MSTDKWKDWKVTAELQWMDGGNVCTATLTMDVMAKSSGHAISRVKDHLAHIGTHEVEDISAQQD